MAGKPNIFNRTRSTKFTGGSDAIRDRSAAYRRQRFTILATEPLCRYCRALGHVTIANLAPACHACNDAKAIIEARYAKRGYDITSVSLDPELGEWLRRAQSDGDKPV